MSQDSDEEDSDDANDKEYAAENSFLLDLDELEGEVKKSVPRSTPQEPLSAGSAAFYSPPSSVVSSLSSTSNVNSSSLFTTKTLEYSRGPKGKLTAHHMNPRPKKSKDITLSFVELVFGGDTRTARAMVATFVEASRNHLSEEADGFVLSLITMGATQRQLKHVLKIGSGRFDRVKNGLKKKERGGSINGREITDVMENDIAAFITSLTYEEGYPCAGKRMKRYICDEGIDSWIKFHARYLEFAPDPANPVQKLAYSTIHRYMLAVHRDILLHRTKEDECDECARLMTSLAGASAGEEIADLKTRQKLHWEQARNQRRALKDAMRFWARNIIDSAAVVQPVSAITYCPDTSCTLASCFGGLATRSPIWSKHPATRIHR
jgi:hypothetical protein